MDYSNLKASYFDKTTQFILFGIDGEVINTCGTLFEIPLAYNVYAEIPFLESLSVLLNNASHEEILKYPCIKMNILGVEGYFDLVFHRKDNLIHWFLHDLTELYEDLIHIQQERNVASISEELLQSQQKVSKLKTEFLAFQNEELKRLQSFKTEFFAKVSHELRTPVSGILGLTQMLTLVENEKNQNYLDTIKATSNHLLSIVNDVLDLSKIEAGELQLQKRSFDLKKIVEQVICSFEPLVSEKDIYLKLKISKDIPKLLHGDPIRLSQILFNIIGNSIRFTEKGGVSLNINLKQQQENAVTLQFLISDTGIGIDSNKIDTILKPYSQENEGTNEKYGGTGLGLSIVKQLVLLHKGKFDIQSEKDEGTTITIELTYQESKKKQEPLEEKNNDITPVKDAVKKRVLLVEDDDLNLKIAEQLLIKSGFEVVTAKHAKSIFPLLDKKSFNFMLLDYNLDDFNGEDILFYVRNHYDPFINQLPVYILTAGLSSAKVNSLKRNGVDEIFLKPLSEKQLLWIEKEGGKRESKVVVENEVNLDFVRSISDGDTDKFVEIVKTFQSKIPEVLNIIRISLKKRDWEAMGGAIHKIKPNFSYLGMNMVVDLMEKLEHEIGNKPDYELCERIVYLTGSYFSKVNEQINNELRELN